MANQRFQVLDGWRAISISLVLLCHFFPFGPKQWQIGPMIGVYGMSIFFILSGFLVTHLLLENQSIGNFLIRRFFRIVPLGWLYLTIVFLIYPADLKTLVSHYLFYANYPPKPLIPHITDHFWSLCVEIHFYLAIALLVAIFRKSGLLVLPLLALLITILRINFEMKISVITHFRVDEILAGCTLCLIYFNQYGKVIKQWLSRVNVKLMILLLIICSHPDAGWFCYARPYVAAMMIGATLMQPDSRLSDFLSNKHFKYLATISFAVYVWHLLLADTWLGTGDLYEKYMKRPLLLLVVIFVAHVSTFYFEKTMINVGKKIALKKSIATN